MLICLILSCEMEKMPEGGTQCANESAMLSDIKCAKVCDAHDPEPACACVTLCNVTV